MTYVAGNFGVGNASPSFNLDVTGTARITTGITTGGVNTSNLIASNITVSNLIASTFSPSNLNTTNVTCTSLLATNITSGGLEITGSGVVDTPNLTVTSAATVSSLQLTAAIRSLTIGGDTATSPYSAYIANTAGYLELCVAGGAASYSGSAVGGDGVIRSNKNLILQASGAGNAHMFISTRGNIGIGTTSPSVDLHMSRSNTVASLFIDQFNSNGIGTGRAAFQSWNVNNSRSSLAIGSNVFLDQSANIQGYNFTTGSTFPVGWSILMGNFYDALMVTRHSGTTSQLMNLSSNGSLSITGSLSKGSGSFDIVHPNDETKRLVHSFIEGPRCDLIYRGQVQLSNGQAIVNLDTDCVAEADCTMTTGTFESLCANPQYSLQNHTSFSRVKGSINGAILTIECENANSTDMIYWSVIAERKDPHIKQWNRTNSNGYLVTEYNNSQ
jgi:hypothetical protein